MLATPQLSIVIPAYNEQDNVVPLYQELISVLDAQELSDSEIIFVDDGSRDGTAERLEYLASTDSRIVVVTFRKNFGQTAAMDAGFREARGEIVIPMDADMQNDPQDIPKLIKAMSSGLDVVSGHRKARNDPWHKRLLSRGANRLRKLLFDDQISDSGCTLKAYRREALSDLQLFGEMHRFVPALLSLRGYRVDEIEVNHRGRHSGTTKYSASRVLKGFLDMLVVRFWMEFATRPVHLFGSFGLISSFLGSLMLLYLLFVKLLRGADIGGRPLLSLAVLLVVLGVQFLMFGFLGDMVAKIYHKGASSYWIRDVRRSSDVTSKASTHDTVAEQSSRVATRA